MEELEDEKRKDLEVKDTEIEAVMHALASKETELHNARRDLDAAQTKLGDVRTDRDNKHTQMLELQNNVSLMEENSRESEKTIAAKQAEIEELERRVRSMEEAVSVHANDNGNNQQTCCSSPRKRGETDVEKHTSEAWCEDSDSRTSHCGDTCKVCGRGDTCMVCGADDAYAWGGKKANVIFSEFSDAVSGNFK
jgi:hypothetical protein